MPRKNRSKRRPGPRKSRQMQDLQRQRQPEQMLFEGSSISLKTAIREARHLSYLRRDELVEEGDRD